MKKIILFALLKVKFYTVVNLKFVNQKNVCVFNFNDSFQLDCII